MRYAPLLLVANVALAQDYPLEPRYALEVDTAFALESDLDDAEGGLSFYSVGANLDVVVPIRERTQLIFAVGGEGTFYDFDEATDFVPGTNDPWGDVYTGTFRVLVNTQIDERFGLLVGGGVRSAHEAGGDISGSYAAQTGVGLSYAFSEDLKVGGGFWVSTELEGGVYLSPFPIVEWQITEEWSLSTIARGARLTWRPDETWALFATTQFRRNEFRLDEDGPLPDGVGRHRRTTAALGAQWDPSPNFSVTGTVGTDLFHELEALDSNGSRVGKTDVDLNVAFGLRAQVKF